MKIDYKLRTGGVGSWTALADDASATLLDKISGFRAVPSKQPEVVPLVRSEAPFIADRGNRLWAVSFLVDRSHATPDAAALFCATHPLIFENQLNLDLRITVGGQVLYLSDAAVAGCEPAGQSDKSTLFNYAFIGRQYGTAVPE